MPLYTPILDLSQRPLEELALQLIRGVDWLHTQLISHCDIKQKNLVFDEKRNRLLIIDFELSVKLTSRDETVQGGRGTPDHVAPEVGVESSYESGLEELFVKDDSIYSPILADVWAVGDVIKGLHELFENSTESIGTVVGQVAKELQVDDPTVRLSLHDAERRIAAECSTAAAA
jgi:serine/threonine protein kinase